MNFSSEQRIKNICIEISDLSCLQMPTKDNVVSTHLTGQIIDALMKSRELEYCNFTYIRTTFATEIWSKSGVNDASLWYNFDKDFLVVPILQQYHWKLLIASKKTNEVTIIDPYLASKNTITNEQFQQFLKFVTRAQNNESICDAEWKISNHGFGLPSQASNDIVNCGVYILIYVDIIFGNRPAIEPTNKRVELRTEILKYNPKIECNVCLGCSESLDCCDSKMLDSIMMGTSQPSFYICKNCSYFGTINETSISDFKSENDESELDGNMENCKYIDLTLGSLQCDNEVPYLEKVLSNLEPTVETSINNKFQMIETCEQTNVFGAKTDLQLEKKMLQDFENVLFDFGLTLPPETKLQINSENSDQRNSDHSISVKNNFQDFKHDHSDFGLILETTESQIQTIFEISECYNFDNFVPGLDANKGLISAQSNFGMAVEPLNGCKFQDIPEKQIMNCSGLTINCMQKEEGLQDFGLTFLGKLDETSLQQVFEIPQQNDSHCFTPVEAQFQGNIKNTVSDFGSESLDEKRKSIDSDKTSGFKMDSDMFQNLHVKEKHLDSQKSVNFTKKEEKKLRENNKYTSFYISEQIIDFQIFNQGKVDNEKIKEIIKDIGFFQKVTCMFRFRQVKYFKATDTLHVHARCLYEEHADIRYKFTILNCSSMPKINCTSTGNCRFEHSGKVKYYQCRGEKRKEFQNDGNKPDVTHLKLMDNVDLNLVKKGNSYGVFSRPVIQKAKSEFKCKKRAIAGCDILSAVECQNIYPDYVQEVSTPLQIHMYTKVQVQVLKQLQLLKMLLILFLDATGSIVRSPICHNHPGKSLLYYAGVISAHESIVPMFEFISSSHDVQTVTRALLKYRTFLTEECKFLHLKWPVFGIVVTDYSWVLIRSVLSAFNNMGLIDYMEIVCQHMNDKTVSIDYLTLPFICCAHFMKIIANQIKSRIYHKNNNKILKKFIKKTFALMIDCTSLEELKNLFSKFVFIIESPILTEKVQVEVDNVLNSHFKSEEIKLKYETSTKESELENDQEYMTQDVERENIFDFLSSCDSKNPNKTPVYQKSPLFNVFNDLKQLARMQIENDTNDTMVKNIFYVPDSGAFVDFISKQYFPYAMLWSAIVVGKRFSNAIGENFFRLMKSVWHPNRSLEPSTFIQSQYEKVNQSVKRFNLDDIIKKKEEDHISTPSRKKLCEIKSVVIMTPKSQKSNNDDPFSPSLRETWGESGKKRKSSTFNTHLQSPFTKKIKFDPTIVPVGSVQTPIKRKLTDTKKTTNLSKKIKLDFSINSSENGWNSKYYLNNPTNLNYVVCKLDLGKKQPCKVMYKDYRTLDFDEKDNSISKFWLRGEVIDILVKLREIKSKNDKHCKKFIYIDHVEARKIFGGLGLIDGIKSKYLNSNYKNVDCIISAFCSDNHWYLVVADIKQKTIAFVNPYEPHIKSDKKQWFNNFNKFLLRIKKNPDLDRSDWCLKKINKLFDLPIQPETNYIDCGILIVMYIDSLIFENLKNRNPVLQRKMYQNEILFNSLDVSNDCLVCGIPNIAIKCVTCSRSLCSKCVKPNVCQKDDSNRMKCFLCVSLKK
jgi:hypothetical protein